MKKAIPTTRKAHHHFNIFFLFEWLGLPAPTFLEFIWMNLVGSCLLFTFFVLMVLFY